MEELLELNEWLIERLQEALETIDNVYGTNTAIGSWVSDTQEELKKKLLFGLCPNCEGIGYFDETNRNGYIMECECCNGTGLDNKEGES